MSSRRSSSTQRVLNRLVDACKNDQVALRATAAEVPRAGAKERLLERVRRRQNFQRELGAHLQELGGAVRERDSFGPQARAFLRRIRGVLLGKHEGDAYRACAREEARSEGAYARALRRGLPASIRRTVERQHAEILLDQQELRLLQWGVYPRGLAPPAARAATGDSTRAAATGNAEALSRWNDDGGPQPEP